MCPSPLTTRESEAAVKDRRFLSSSSTSERARKAFIAVLAAIAFLAFLGRANIVTDHEARVALTARVMAESGWPWSARPVAVPRPILQRVGNELQSVPSPDGSTLQVNPWVVPVYRGRVRLEKPPLAYWCAALALMWIDNIGLGARLIPALLGLLSVPITYDLARRLLGRTIGMLAALTWISSYFIVSEFRKSMADPYLTFFTLSATWAWLTQSQERRRGNSALRLALLACFYGSLGLGILSKGPWIFLHVGITLAALWWTSAARQPSQIARRASQWWAHLAGVALILIIAAPWPMYVLARIPDAPALWNFEAFGENLRSTQPWYFYFPQLFMLALPWTPLLVFGIPYAVSRQHRRLRFALIWYAATVLIFSLGYAKKNAYILPMVPAQTILIAQTIPAILRTRRPRATKKDIVNWTILIQRILGCGLAVAVALLIFYYGAKADQLTAGGLAVRIPAAAVAVALGALPLMRRFVPKGEWFTPLAVCSLLLLALFLSLPHADHQNQRRSLDEPDAAFAPQSPFSRTS